MTALDGALVLSVGHTLPGYYCMAALRDLGAEVLRIERPRAERAGAYDGVAAAFPIRSLDAGTSECRLDLKNEAGRDAFVRLAARASVVLDGFRPGVSVRLGIDAERLLAANPRLVHAAISGYGQEGALSDRVGHDLNYLAETGVLGLANPLGLPGATFADGLAGLAAALNVVGALLGVRDTGRGVAIDLAIVDAPLMLMSSELEHYFATGESRAPGDTHLSGRWPWYDVHLTRDGAVALGAVEPRFYSALCAGLGEPELASRQLEEGDGRSEARKTVERALSRRTQRELLPLLDGPESCASPVRSIAEVAASPLMERALRPGQSPGERLVRTPVRLAPGPLPPERSDGEALSEHGFAPEEIEALRAAGALAR